MRSKKRGSLWIILGLLLLAAALALYVYNMWTSAEAGKTSQGALDELTAIIQEKGTQYAKDKSDYYHIRPTSSKKDQDPDDPAKSDDPNDPEKSGEEDYDDPGYPDFDDMPVYLKNPEVEMPIVVTSEGLEYIGVIELLPLGIILPVLSDWNYDLLHRAPCRYRGSIYQDNMIVCAHNYDVYFGKLYMLKIGDQVRYTDMAGNVFVYEVVEMETILRENPDQMLDGDWDLTLFTCTVGGLSRVTVRLERIKVN